MEKLDKLNYGEVINGHVYKDVYKLPDNEELINKINEIVDELNKQNKPQEIKVKKLSKLATIPTQGSTESAGYDLYACLPKVSDKVEIAPHTNIKIGTGLSIELPNGTFGGVFARSGLATKQGLRPSNCVGVCDSDYRGEYIVVLYNDSDETRIVNHGDRIAQLIILNYNKVELIESSELSDTERGEGGFGHTGV